MTHSRGSLSSFLRGLLPTFHLDEWRPVDLSTHSVCIRVQTGPSDTSVGFIVVPSDGREGTRGVAILAARSPFMIEISEFSSRAELRTLVRDLFLRNVAIADEPPMLPRYRFDFYTPGRLMPRVMMADAPEGEIWSHVRDFVGGYMETWRGADGTRYVFREDGVLAKLPRNEVASSKAGVDIVGPCVVIVDREGVTE